MEDEDEDEVKLERLSDEEELGEPSDILMPLLLASQTSRQQNRISDQQSPVGIAFLYQLSDRPKTGARYEGIPF